MPCDIAPSMKFAVYDFLPDGTECNTGKTFSISKQENDDILRKFGYHIGESIDENALVLMMFHKLFTFTIGPNGFRVVWDKNEDGDPMRFVSGCFYWHGPRAPACQIGGNWWRIKRLV